MHCLTESEISQWLQQRGIVGDTYHQSHSTGHYLQFYAPKNHRTVSAFLRNYGELITGGSEGLVHITDWSLYTQSEMIPIMGIRSLHDEKRWLIDAPGHCLASNEMDVAVSLVVLTTAFAWSTYWYCPASRSTLYNWEGDIFDFWTDDPAMMEIMKKLILDFDLHETKNSEINKSV